MTTPYRFLWITDPWKSLSHPDDTTLRLIEASLQHGTARAPAIESYWADVRSIRFVEGRVELDCAQLLSVRPGRSEAGFVFGPTEARKPTEFTHIFYRTDPPVDLAYFHPLQLLALALGLDPAARTEIVSPLEVLFQCSEKLQMALLHDLMPPTVAAATLPPLEAFGLREGKTVLKPMHDAQSRGVHLLDWSTEDGRAAARRTIESASAGLRSPVLLQRYLPGIMRGELRMWFVNGSLIAAARKKPKGADFRMDSDGGILATSPLTPDQRQAAELVGRRLHQSSIRMAAVDLIDGYVTDFNFTSPGLLVEMETLLKRDLAPMVIERLLQPFGEHPVRTDVEDAATPSAVAQALQPSEA